MPRSKARLGLAPVPAFLPLVVKKNGRDDHGADAQETDLQLAHVKAAAGFSRNFRASSISTATTRDTPRSCMVTPPSWGATSIAIFLWLMKRNWVGCATFSTKLHKP